ncbi:MAG: hypothetical protein QXV17_02605 [Candidatus Micrarchaeaceae archaeon]|uniref:hypothetical protein n=1 Tax=Metallosphaera sp. TaxID=2020860 RepID=UPI0031662EE7
MSEEVARRPPICSYLKKDEKGNFVCTATGKEIDPAFRPCLLPFYDRIKYCDDLLDKIEEEYSKTKGWAADEELSKLLIEVLTNGKCTLDLENNHGLINVVLICGNKRKVIQTLKRREVLGAFTDYYAILRAILVATR